MVKPTVATVARIDFGGVRLLDDTGAWHDATVPSRLRGPRRALGNAVVTGDRVRVMWDGERMVVEEVEPRRNAFSRREMIRLASMVMPVRSGPASTAGASARRMRTR